VPGNPQGIEAEFTRPIADQVTLDVALQLTGTSGIGNLRLPQLDAVGVRNRRRLLGVTVDAGLEFQEPALVPAARLPAADFVAAWGSSEAPPRLAYRLPAESLFSLAVRPRKPQKNVNAALAIGLSHERALLRYEATLTSPSGAAFEHRLQAPPALRIDSIAITEEGVNRLARWTREESGAITLRLNDGVRGPHQLTLEGSVPLANRGNWPLPRLTLDDAIPAASQIRVYRHSDVLIDIRARKGLAEQPLDLASLSTPDSRFAALGRLTHLFAAEPGSSAVFNVQPNNPRYEVRQTTSLRREAGSWLCEVDVRVGVRSGIVDELRFDIPEWWTGPFHIAPQAATGLTIAPGETRRHLVIRPPVALAADVRGSEHRYRLRGNVSLVVGKPLSVPIVRLRGAQNREETVVLAAQLDSQPLSWETRGLLPAPLPAEWAGAGTMTAFNVVDDDCSATLRAAERAVGQPTVRLADISAAWGTGGSVRGVCTFDLDPAGELECPLVVPPGCRLLQVQVGSVPATLLSAGEGRYRVPLVSNGLPQCVEVTFASEFADSAFSRGRFEVPRLGDLEVEQTVWHVVGPPGSGVANAVQMRQIGLLRHELVRLRAMLELLRRAAARLEEEPTEAWAAWYRIWQPRWHSSLDAARLELDRMPQTDPGRIALASELRKLEEDQETEVPAIAVSLAPAPADAMAPADQPRQLFAFSTPDDWPSRRMLFSRAVPELEVRLGPSRWNDWGWRLLGVLAMGLVFGLAVVIHRAGAWRRLWRWRYLAALAASAAWWYWLRPSELGLLLAALCVVAWARSLVRRTRERESAIVSLSGPSDPHRVLSRGAR
jgi:hypothetical protein